MQCPNLQVIILQLRKSVMRLNMINTTQHDFIFICVRMLHFIYIYSQYGMMRCIWDT